MRHFVMRTHSHTDLQMLWKVMSRGFKDKHDAENWAEYCEFIEKNPEHNFFVVTVEDETEVFKNE